MYQVIVNGLIRAELKDKMECDRYLIDQHLSKIDGESGERTLNEGVSVNINMVADAGQLNIKYGRMG